MKIIEINMRITKIMKKLEIYKIIMNHTKKTRNHFENHENLENL